MMTKKHARRFGERVREGERPKLPAVLRDLLRTTAEEIHFDICHARTWDYGNRYETHAKRLVQMELLDHRYEITEIGKEYRDQGL